LGRFHRKDRETEVCGEKSEIEANRRRAEVRRFRRKDRERAVCGEKRRGRSQPEERRREEISPESERNGSLR